MSLSMDAHIHVSVNKEIPVLIVDLVSGNILRQ